MTRLRRARLRCAALATCGALIAGSLLTASPATAATFDVEGRLVLDGGASFAFDDADPIWSTFLFDWNNDPVDFTSRIAADEQGLEGAGALELGGEAWYLAIGLENVAAQFVGRRVDVRIWQQPRGTDAKVTMDWTVGSPGSFRDSFNAGTVTLLPTGRVTSDGWREYATGPIDFQLAGALAPTSLAIQDKQVLAYYGSEGLATVSADVRVAIDALEIIDLGPAAVPAATCSVLDEDSVCGERGVCLYGRCADAAAVLGTVPAGDIRDDYIARRRFEMEAFNGVRAARTESPSFGDGLDAALAGPDKAFWPTVTLAYERLRDGHGSAPNPTYTYYGDLGGEMCVYVGEADLSRLGMAPMVFETHDSKPLGLDLAVGDVLVAIDGVDVDTWRAAASRFFYYTGDPLSRGELEMPDVIDAARRAGSVLEFERCGDPCTAANRETITVDYGAGIGDLVYAGEVPENWWRGVTCDFRFSDAVPGSQTNSYTYAASRVDAGVTYVQFNGFPSYYWDGGEEWFTTLGNAFSSAPASVILDQRRGDGGTFDAVVSLTNWLGSPADAVTTELYPWLDSPLSNAELDDLRSCLNAPNQFSCGSFYAQVMPSQNVAGPAAGARVALLNGRDVSGNDYFTRVMNFRSAETRSFGSTRTWGAFGFSCPLPSLLDEGYGGNFQCTDSVFYQGASPDAAAFDWESGRGVPVDEVVYQKQSDAIVGVDTVLEAAEAWVNR